MLTAYLDESGLEKPGVVRVGGFIGNDDQWKKLASEWPKAFEGRQRKSLHIKTLKFKYESEKNLLARLGQIPESCGLRRIMGSVDVRDYKDLVKGTVGEIDGQGYALAIWPLIIAIENVVPIRESYKLVFEEQGALGFYRDKMLELLVYTLSHPPRAKRHVKRPKLVGWEKEIMFQLFSAWLLEAENLAALRIDTRQDVANCTVFAGPVHPLKNHQQGIAARCIK